VQYLGALPRGAPRGFQRGAPFGRKIGVNTPIADSNGKYKIYLVKKDFEKNTVEYVVGIARDGKRIDEYLSEGYIQGRMELK
jgi:hypothetical protein